MLKISIKKKSFTSTSNTSANNQAAMVIELQMVILVAVKGTFVLFA